MQALRRPRVHNCEIKRVKLAKNTQTHTHERVLFLENVNKKPHGIYSQSTTLDAITDKMSSDATTAALALQKQKHHHHLH